MPIRRGSDYLRSIQENHPHVYYDGREVEDITSHPAFRVPVQTMSKMYDLQWEDGVREKLTFSQKGSSEREGITYMIPQSVEELIRMREGLNTIYDNLYGFFGRCYDYLNMWTGVFAAHHADFFGQPDPKYGQNVLDYHRTCMAQDLFLTHAIVAPSVDRSKQASELSDPFIQAGVVEEKSKGIVVRGAAMVSTAAPYAEQMIYFPNMLRDPDPRYAIAFGCPTNVDGIKFLARKSFAPRQGLGEFEYPISARYEESDAMVIFDDALIPWENVFLYKQVEKVPLLMWGGVYMKAWFNYHFSVQYYSRLKFLVGLATTIAQTVGIDKFINVQEKIGELLIYLNLTRSSIVAAEQLSEKLPNGLVRPNPEVAVASSQFNMQAIPRAYEVIKLISGGSLIALPSSHRDLENPEIRKYIDKYMPGKGGISAAERIKVFNLAWDVVSSEAGQRYELYDRFSRGDPTIMWAKMYEQLQEQRDDCVKMVRRLLDSIETPK
ncbi:MAG TPA: 4-hydroxyphenylacetate 3-hydroxylase N-terminal domain-containing protein [Nitrososphaerales archaeon]|nr:4-hydroxyphenylacetate 3-hydroxylase N-terminal domain-containing protein [Nitrososphaerales archaeon]